MARLRPTGYTQACHVLTGILSTTCESGQTQASNLGRRRRGRCDYTSDSKRRVAQAIPDALFEVFENAGHAAYLERPDTYNEVVGNFLRR